eukprot:XP_001701265.1 Ca2+-ATPase [Chlamydomonas reinhardtii]
MDVAAAAGGFGISVGDLARLVTFWELVAEALEDFTVQALLAAGLLSLGLSSLEGPAAGSADWVEGVAILGTVALVVAVGAGTGYAKEAKFRQLNALKDDVQVRVIRGGGPPTPLPARQLLADGLLVAGDEIRLDQSHLTGESDDVIRCAEPLDSAGGAAAGSMMQRYSGSRGPRDRTPLGTMGTMGSVDFPMLGSTPLSTPGSGTAATTTGTTVTTTMDQAGRKGAIRDESGLAQAIGAFGVAAAGAVFASYLDLVITSITILVVAVPEGLPLAVTLALAFSVQRMLADNNLVRQLGACETMGAATTICSDKTGTLTSNNMTVVRLWTAGRHFGVKPLQPQQQLLPAAATPSGAVASTTGASVGGGDGGVGNSATTRTPVAPFDRVPSSSGGTGATGSLSAGGMASSWRTATASTTTSATATAVAAAAATAGRVAAQLVPLPAMEDSQASLTSGSDVEAAAGSAAGSSKGAATAGQQLLPGRIRDLLVQGLVLNSTACLKPNPTTGGFDRSGSPTDRTLSSSIGTMQSVDMEDARSGGPGDSSIGSSSGTANSSSARVGSGAAELVLERCSWVLLPRGEGQDGGGGGEVAGDTEVRPLSAEQKQRLLASFRGRGGGALRLLALAYRDMLDLVLVGLVGLQDPLRPEVPGAVAACTRAGITLREQGALEEVVAVTGDGTNDAPALTAADVGFCMASGTPIAKEAADILLLDSSFAPIVAAVAWGRNVYASVTRFLQFQLTANVVAVAVAVGGAVWLGTSPLSAVQMLWVNLIMDSLASLALATEAPTASMLTDPPNRPNDPLITPIVMKHVVGQLFNQVNCRRVRDEADVTEGLAAHPLFLGIVGAEAGLQWGLCLGLGAGVMAVREGLRRVKL